jgi:hypothetical protein
MKHTTLVLLLAFFASGAGAADPAASQPMSGTPKTAPPSKKSAAPPKLTPTEERLLAVSNTKAKFLAAVGSCPRPEECDPDSPRKNPELVNLVKSAEDAFMEACAQCATDKACEEERTRIRSGKGRFGYNVCAATQGKSADKKGADKKATSTTKPPAAPSK